MSCRAHTTAPTPVVATPQFDFELARLTASCREHVDFCWTLLSNPRTKTGTALPTRSGCLSHVRRYSLYSPSSTKYEYPRLSPGSAASLEISLRLSRKLALIAKNREWRYLWKVLIHASAILQAQTSHPEVRFSTQQAYSYPLVDMQDIR